MRLCLKEMIPVAKKRQNGEGTLRLRKDGRWEGRIVVGYNEKSLPITKCVTAKTKTECSTKLEALKEPVSYTHLPCKRYKSIKVKYQTMEMQNRIKTYTSWTTQIIQHEIDHCNGILI